jgi:hypothetical protein
VVMLIMGMRVGIELYVVSDVQDEEYTAD